MPLFGIEINFKIGRVGHAIVVADNEEHAIVKTNKALNNGLEDFVDSVVFHDVDALLTEKFSDFAAIYDSYPLLGIRCLRV